MLFLVKFLLLGSFAFAQEYYDGRNGNITTEPDVLKGIQSGQILIVSELHDNEAHHQNQRDLLVRVSKSAFPISVGMEFFDYTDQNFVTQFGQDLLDEETFLKLIKWGSTPFNFYRFQVRVPYYLYGQTYALNFPRALSGKVAKFGLDSLTTDEKKLMPPNFALGANTYFERFSETMKGHVSEEKIKNYFAAQSLWDDTMAWQAAQAMKMKPTQLLMIIVGDFHVAYQDGLIARLKARGVSNIISISQVDSAGLSVDEKTALIQPDLKYGVRADYIFDSAINKK